MRELLTEFFAGILLEEYSEEEKKKMGIPLDAVSSGGKWYDKKPEDGGNYIGKVVDKKFVPATPEEKEQDKQERASNAAGKPTEPAAKATAKTPSAPQQPQQSFADVPTPRVQDIITVPDDEDIDPNERALTADLSVGMAEKDAAGVVEQLTQTNAELVRQRTLGVPGPGGARASYGEVGLTDFANRVSGGLKTFIENEKNREQIKDAAKQYANPKPGVRIQNRINAVAKELGLDPKADRDVIALYMGARDIYSQQVLQQLKDDPNSVYHKSGKAGFDRDDKAVIEWAQAQFDGAIATHESIFDSKIDRTKPYTIIQSEARPGGHDEQLVKHLIAEMDKARQSGDADAFDHYRRQLDAWQHAGFHDTMAVGQDKQGRLTVLHITNKKGNELKDIWHNTTPGKALRTFTKGFMAREALSAEQLPEDKRPTYARTLKTVGDALVAASGKATQNNADAGQTFADKLQIDDGLVTVMQLLETGKVPGQNKRYLGPIVKKKAFAKWAAENLSPEELKEMGLRIVRDKKGKITGAEETSKKPTTEQTAARLRAVQQHAQAIRALKKKVPGAILRLMTKTDEIIDDVRKIKGYEDLSSKGLDTCRAVKRAQSSTLEEIHSDVVKAVTDADAELGYPIDGENGPHTKTYIATVMTSLHFDAMVINYDEDIAVVTGIRNSKPEDFRQCLGELSGAPELSGKELNDHLLKRCRLDPKTREIQITSSDGKTTHVIAQDSWRTSGAGGGKVAKTIGHSLRECVMGKADARRQSRSDRYRQALS